MRTPLRTILPDNLVFLPSGSETLPDSLDSLPRSRSEELGVAICTYLRTFAMNGHESKRKIKKLGRLRGVATSRPLIVAHSTVLILRPFAARKGPRRMLAGRSRRSAVARYGKTGRIRNDAGPRLVEAEARRAGDARELRAPSPRFASSLADVGHRRGDGEDERGTLHRSAESAGERTGGATVACSRRGATVRAAGVNVCCSGVGVNAEPSRPVANDGKQSRAAFAASEGKSVAEPVEGQAVATACFACLQPPWPPPWRAV